MIRTVAEAGLLLNPASAGDSGLRRMVGENAINAITGDSIQGWGEQRPDLGKPSHAEKDALMLMVRLQLHAPADNFANFLRTLALPEEAKQRSLTPCATGW